VFYNFRDNGILSYTALFVHTWVNILSLKKGDYIFVILFIIKFGVVFMKLKFGVIILAVFLLAGCSSNINYDDKIMLNLQGLTRRIHLMWVLIKSGY